MNEYGGPIPDPTLPKWQAIPLRPFDIEIIPRELRKAAAGGATGGAFFTMRTVTGAVDPLDDGDIYLQGGMVSGGTGNVVIPEFKLYDASSAAWVGSPAAGDTLIITASGTGQVTSGILDPIWNLDTATLTKAAVGTNSLPIATSAGSGKICYILVGSYFDDGFAPSAPGNFNITFCWGGYTITRS